MARAVFSKLEDFENWVKDQTRVKAKHAMYITNSREAILVPRVSTSPRMYGYYQGSDEEMILLKKFSQEIGVAMYRVKAFEWDTEKPVGVIPKY